MALALRGLQVFAGEPELLHQGQRSFAVIAGRWHLDRMLVGDAIRHCAEPRRVIHEEPGEREQPQVEQEEQPQVDVELGVPDFDDALHALA